MRSDVIVSATSEAAKAAPPTAVAGAVAAGITLDDVVVALTIVYLVGQITYLVWRWVGEWRQKRRAAA